MSWTPQNRERAIGMWREGHSASQIARVVGGVSRNAVIGLMHRAGVSQRGKAATPVIVRRTYTRRVTIPAGSGAFSLPPTANAPQMSIAQRAVHGAQERATYVEPASEEAGSVKLIDLTAHMCRWPIGDPASDDFRFCGMRQAVGSYCADHAKRAFVAPPARRLEANGQAPVARRFHG